jgi:Spy/CpxP family protein refolding chaperone
MRRRTVIGLSAAAIGSLVVGAAAFAGAGHGPGREAMMRRMATAAIDGALDEAQASPEQRAAIHAACDRVFAAIQDHRRDRQARLDGMLTLFESDRLDDGLRELRGKIEGEHGKIAETIGAALVEAHAVLTPSQRKVVADYVRNHRPMHP